MEDHDLYVGVPVIPCVLFRLEWISFAMQPQDLVLPATNAQPLTKASFPQSQTHRHLIRLFGMRCISIANSLSNFLPARSDIFMRSFYCTIVVSFCLTLSSCASSVTHSPAPLVLPASLRAPCPALVAPDDGSAGSILRWAVETVRAYQVCADRHQETVQAWPR